RKDAGDDGNVADVQAVVHARAAAVLAVADAQRVGAGLLADVAEQAVGAFGHDLAVGVGGLGKWIELRAEYRRQRLDPPPLAGLRVEAEPVQIAGPADLALDAGRQFHELSGAGRVVWLDLENRSKAIDDERFRRALADVGPDAELIRPRSSGRGDGNVDRHA